MLLEFQRDFGVESLEKLTWDIFFQKLSGCLSNVLMTQGEQDSEYNQDFLASCLKEITKKETRESPSLEDARNIFFTAIRCDSSLDPMTSSVIADFTQMVGIYMDIYDGKHVEPQECVVFNGTIEASASALEASEDDVVGDQIGNAAFWDGGESEQARRSRFGNADSRSHQKALENRARRQSFYVSSYSSSAFESNERRPITALTFLPPTMKELLERKYETIMVEVCVAKNYPSLCRLIENAGTLRESDDKVSYASFLLLTLMADRFCLIAGRGIDYSDDFIIKKLVKSAVIVAVNILFPEERQQGILRDSSEFNPRFMHIFEEFFLPALQKVNISTIHFSEEQDLMLSEPPFLSAKKSVCFQGLKTAAVVLGERSLHEVLEEMYQRISSIHTEIDYQEMLGLLRSFDENPPMEYKIPILHITSPHFLIMNLKTLILERLSSESNSFDPHKIRTMIKDLIKHAILSAVNVNCYSESDVYPLSTLYCDDQYFLQVLQICFPRDLTTENMTKILNSIGEGLGLPNSESDSLLLRIQSLSSVSETSLNTWEDMLNPAWSELTSGAAMKAPGGGGCY